MGHGVKHIGHGQDARLEGDLVAFQAVGVALSVEALMVMTDYRRQMLQGLGFGDHYGGPVGGVLLDL